MKRSLARGRGGAKPAMRSNAMDTGIMLESADMPRSRMKMK